ncbi:MAG: O-antigen ligase family protein [Xanthobacteraceae bacterium]
MSSLALDTIRRSRSAASFRRNERFFPVMCGSLVVQSLFTFVYHLTGSTAFYAISNSIAIALIGYALIVVLRSGRDSSASTAFLVASVIAISLTVVVNIPNVSTSDVLKYLSLYIFYAAGCRNENPLRPIELYCLYALAVLPIAFMAFGASRIWESQDEPFGYLPNANIAVLHFTALLFAASPVFGNRVILLQLLNAAFMNKIGAIVATVISICMWATVPLRRESVLSAVAIITPVVVIGTVAYQFGAFDRAITAFDGLVFVLNIDPRSVVSMSYQKLVLLTGSTDLSGFFRLIHWTNIWDIYSSGSLGTLLFGYGPGQTPALTYAEMVPHNDYLRILVEYGPINLAIFVGFLVHIRGALKTAPARVLFVVLCIYFFSENLLDSFTSMTLFFAYAGRMAAYGATASATQTLNPIGSRQ